MKAISMRTTIGNDGTIDLRVPCDLPPGDAEVMIIVQQAPPVQNPPYLSDYGVWRDIMPDNDVDTDLREMNRAWEKSMELPE